MVITIPNLTVIKAITVFDITEAVFLLFSALKRK